MADGGGFRQSGGSRSVNVERPILDGQWPAFRLGQYPTAISLDLAVNADNLRAIRFYEKQGFAPAGDDVNPLSGAPVRKMSWRP